MKHGGEAEWNFLWAKYKNSNVASEKETILTALTCTGETSILNRLLNWSLNDTQIRRQDSVTIFSGVIKNDKGYNLAKNFLFSNVSAIVKQ